MSIFGCICFSIGRKVTMNFGKGGKVGEKFAWHFCGSCDLRGPKMGELYKQICGGAKQGCKEN